MNSINDDPIIANAIADMVLNEDDPNPTVDLSNVFDDVDIVTNADVLTYTLSNGNAAMFDGTPIVGGMLTLDLAADQWGLAVITVEAKDIAGAAVVDTFQIIVKSINDNPFVANPIADIAMLEDDPAISLDLSNVFDDVDILTEHCDSYNASDICFTSPTMPTTV